LQLEIDLTVPSFVLLAQKTLAKNILTAARKTATKSIYNGEKA